MVCEVETLEEFTDILNGAGDKLVVVDFTATWCGPCKQISPVFEELAGHADNKNVIFLKVDVDEAQDVAQHCKISSMPTFHFYKKATLIFNFSGSNQAMLREQVEKLR